MQVQLGQRLHRPDDLVAVLGHQRAQFAQHPFDFALLGQLQFAPAVVELQRGQWLHENGGSRGRLVVDDALDASLVLHLDGNHVPPGPLGNDGLLQPGLVSGVRDDPLELFQQAVVGGGQIAADLLELGAGRVLHLAVVTDGLLNSLNQRPTRLDAVGHAGEGGKLVAPPQDQVAELSGRLERLADVQQVARLEHAPLFGLHNQGAHISRAADGRLWASGQQVFGLGCELKTALYLLGVGAGRQPQGQLPPG